MLAITKSESSLSGRLARTWGTYKIDYAESVLNPLNFVLSRVFQFTLATISHRVRS